MVGHVTRDGRNFKKPTPVAAGPEQQVGLRKAIVQGTAEIRDAEGNLKGTFEFGGEGETHLTPEQFEQEFGVPVITPENQEKHPVEQGGSENGGDSNNDG